MIELMKVLAEETRTTRARILVSAEALFAERGFEVVSLREITGAAGANVAAVNYHFGSKEKLIDAVVTRHLVPVNEERLRQLDKLEKQFSGAPIPVEDILKAFLSPVLEHIASGEMSEDLFKKFMGRLIGERGYSLPAGTCSLFTVMAGRFAAAFQRAVPQLDEESALWRMHFSFGVMAHTLTNGETLRQLSDGKSGNPSTETLLGNIIEFCRAGIEFEGREL